MNIEQVILISLDNCTSLELSHNNHICPLMKVNGIWSVMYGNPFMMEGEFFLEIKRLKGRKIQFQGEFYSHLDFESEVLYDAIVKFEDLKQTLYFGIDSEVFAVKTQTEFESIMRYIQNNQTEFTISVGEPLPNGVSENQLELGFPVQEIESEFNFEYENENTRWVFWRKDGFTSVKMFTHGFVKNEYKGYLKLKVNGLEFPMLDKLCLLDIISYFFHLNKPKIMEDSWTEFNSPKNCKTRIQSKIEKILEKNNHKSLVVSE